MPVNFTYGLAFHFAGCSVEIKQIYPKGFWLKAVDPTAGGGPWLPRAAALPATPSTAAAPWGGEQGLKAPLVTKTAK